MFDVLVGGGSTITGAVSGAGNGVAVSRRGVGDGVALARGRGVAVAGLAMRAAYICFARCKCATTAGRKS
jgi:hypothetical protein